MDKAELRKIIKADLAALTPQTFRAAGSVAARRLGSIPRWGSFPSVLAFFSMKDEIDTMPVMEAALKAGKALFAPRIEGAALVFYRIGSGNLSGGLGDPRGYREPEAAPALALQPEHFPVLVITPGLAFDSRLHRLGRGRGCYDRFFAALDAAGQRYSAVGLCLDRQLVGQVPVCPWDRDMDLILTESGIL